MIDNGGKSTLPSWVRRFKQGGAKYVPPFEDLQKLFVYFRSVRRLLADDDAVLKQSLIDVRNCIDWIFTEHGFGCVEMMTAVLDVVIEEGFGPEVEFKDRKKNLHANTPWSRETRAEKKAKEFLKQGADLSRARSWQYRLEVAIEEAIDDGWFAMFGTYTVDPKRLQDMGCLTRDELWQNTPAWDRFVKKFKTEVADACGFRRKPSKWPPGKTFFRYFAIIEHGASGDHPHVHVVWLCRNIPPSWKVDPNRNCPTRCQVDIPPASALWPHGIQCKTMALFIVGSWFAKNWVLPIDPVSLKPVQVGNAGAVAGYVAKYLAKGGGTKKWFHRVKATKSLGLSRMLRTLNKTGSLRLLLTLATRPNRYPVSMKLQQSTSCPLGLLREKSRQELMRRLHSMKTQRATKFLRQEWTKKRDNFYTNFITSVKDGLRPWKMMPSPRYKCFTQMSREIGSTVHSKKAVTAAVDWLCYNLARRGTGSPFTLLKEALP